MKKELLNFGSDRKESLSLALIDYPQIRIVHFAVDLFVPATEPSPSDEDGD